LKPSIDKVKGILKAHNIINNDSWMTTLFCLSSTGELLFDPKQATNVKRRASSYTIIDNKSYRSGFSIPFLKCVEESQVNYIRLEIHKVINVQHLGRKSLARESYYWSNMQSNRSHKKIRQMPETRRHALSSS
jgi:hypothetical protein